MHGTDSNPGHGGVVILKKFLTHKGNVGLVIVESFRTIPCSLSGSFSLQRYGQNKVSGQLGVRSPVVAHQISGRRCPETAAGDPADHAATLDEPQVHW